MSSVLEFGAIINALAEYPAIYSAAVKRFKPAHQKEKAEEELVELLHAMKKNATGKASDDDVRGEIADVLIMGIQLAIIYGAFLVAGKIVAKLDRLEGLIQKGGEHGEL